ncbi:MAG: hypothetical protein A3J24_02065 [Deltaproteobacteria bacterium RIFCSPLOWO2_02_FULL_53_8]|nr:MAG: hypothetical protein A3J24_02065 [Deltaproteobacteria bacterium RIFCSPLOWO2_02_FULL_53_8]
MTRMQLKDKDTYMSKAPCDPIEALNKRIDECRELLIAAGKDAVLPCADTDKKYLKTNNLLKAISRAQNQFIANVKERELFGELLDTLLPLTESEYGFIGEVFYTPEGKPYLKEYALTNIAWNDATRALLEEHSKTGLEFKNLNSLYGAVLTTGKTVISNRPSEDSRRCGLPHGHPPLNAFLGIPFYFSGRLIGMVGLANRPGGYDQNIVDYLEPLISTCSNIIQAYNNDKGRKSAQEALIKSEATLEHAQHIAKLGHWELDLVNNRLEWSKEIFHIFNLDPDEFKPSYDGFLDVIHPDDRERVNKAYAESVKTRSPYDISHRLLMKDGSTKYVVEKCATQYSDDGTPLRSLGTVQDITERRRNDEQMAKIEKLESLGVLAGGIAHDFNNILTAIMGNIHFARTAENEEQRRKILSQAEKAALHARELTQQFLTFSKGGAPKKKTVLLADFIKSHVEFSLRGSNVSAVFSIDSGLLPVEADIGQIGQIIYNIAMNARHAMPDGGTLRITAANVEITEGLFADLRGGKHIKLSISDSGSGMTDEVMTKIFDPYFTTKSDGNGLGLSSVFSIVKRHEGHIEAESKPGHGSTFHVYLPASTVKAPVLETQRDAITYCGGGRILVMDDEPMVREVTAEILLKEGFEIVCVENGAQAQDTYTAAKAAGRPFDAIIMDLTIPGGMGGKETIKRLLKIDPDAVAIASSGYSNDTTMSEYEKYGFKGAVAKPYRIHELITAVKKALAARSRQTAVK